MCFAALAAIPAMFSGMAGAGAAAGTASALSTAMTVGAGVLSAATALGQANYQNKVAQNNALSAQYAADDAIQRGAVEEEQTRTRTRQLMAQQKAVMAANGLDSSTGTGASLLADSAALGEFDALTVRNNAMKQAYGHKIQADNLIAEGRAAKKAGTGSAIGSLLTSGSKAYGMLNRR